MNVQGLTKNGKQVVKMFNESESFQVVTVKTKRNLEYSSSTVVYYLG